MDDPSALDLAVEAIRADLLVAVPTETVYGLACALTDAAVDRLVEAKGRDVGKGITLLVDDLADAAALDRRVARGDGGSPSRFWPGPLTMVVPLQPGVELPYAVTGGYACGRAAGARSAVHSSPRPGPGPAAPDLGQPFGRVRRAGCRGGPGDRSATAVELIVDGGRSPGGVPSTVVALEVDGSWRLLRAGPITEAELTQALA